MAEVESDFFTTDDGVKLWYTDRSASNAAVGTVVFLHGWAANSRWFDRNLPLAKELRVVTLGAVRPAALRHNLARRSRAL